MELTDEQLMYCEQLFNGEITEGRFANLLNLNRLDARKVFNHFRKTIKGEKFQ
jgi:hypothetical protein